jgi:hypothetical protein
MELFWRSRKLIVFLNNSLKGPTEFLPFFCFSNNDTNLFLFKNLPGQVFHYEEKRSFTTLTHPTSNPKEPKGKYYTQMKKEKMTNN